MDKYVIGIDPDSEKHGVAIYENGKLAGLDKMNLWDIMELTESLMLPRSQFLFSIEDVMANQFVYDRNRHSNKSAESKIAMRIGRCQQSQVELQRLLDRFGYKYVNYRPQKANWSKHKAIFEKVTGWDKKSNEDTRSAAYFGWMALNEQ